MRHLLAVCCVSMLLALAASEQQPPSDHQDASGQERQRPRPRPAARLARDMRPAVQRWARPANVANGALLLLSGLPVAMQGGLLNLQPIGLLLGGWVSLFGMLLLLVEVRLKPVRDWLRRNFGFLFHGSGCKAMFDSVALLVPQLLPRPHGTQAFGRGLL